MQHLQRSSGTLAFAVLVLSGCATPSFYRVANRDDEKIELEVTPDRILLECEDASENRENPYGFMIHVLDDEMTVLDVFQGNTLAKSDCYGRINEIQKILRNGKRIYIAGMGRSLDKPRITEKWTYHFPAWGTFNGNGRGLQFFAIANEHGQCFDAYFRNEKPCPQGDEFPINQTSKTSK